MIESRLLEHAIALAEHGSFALAAQSLGMSQSALSRSIQSLETQLDVQLFDRDRRRIEPTDAGQIFLERAREIAGRNAALLQEMGLVQQSQAASFKLAVGPYPAEALVAQVLTDAVQAHPEIQFRVQVENWVEVAKLVRGREADLGVAEVSQLGDDPELRIETLHPLRGFFVVAADHPLLQHKSPTVEQILGFPLVSTARLPPRVLAPLQQQRPADKCEPFPAVLCEKNSILRRMVAQSHAVGMFTLPVIEAELRAGSLTPLACDVPWLRTQFGILHLRNRPLSQVGERIAQSFRTASDDLHAVNARLVAEFAA